MTIIIAFKKIENARLGAIIEPPFEWKPDKKDYIFLSQIIKSNYEVLAGCSLCVYRTTRLL